MTSECLNQYTTGCPLADCLALAIQIYHLATNCTPGLIDSVSKIEGVKGVAVLPVCIAQTEADRVSNTDIGQRRKEEEEEVLTSRDVIQATWVEPRQKGSYVGPALPATSCRSDHTGAP